MRTASFTQRMLAVSLAIILVSCSAARHSTAGPTGPQDLARYAILFETQPDGTVTHTWKPVSEINMSQYQHQLALAKVGGRVERTSVMTDDDINTACGEVYDSCSRLCMSRAIPHHARHYFAYFPNTRAGKLAAKMRFCEEECAKERNACYERLRRQRQEAVEFSNAERAIEWIKRNKEALAVGAVVVIAAVVFVAVVCGTGGCVLLIPIVLFASSEAPTGHYIAEACQ